MNSFLLLSQRSTQFLPVNHYQFWILLNFYLTIVQSWLDNLTYNNQFLLVWRFYIASWRIESYMLFFNISNKLRYSFNTGFQKSFCKHLQLLSSFYCVLLDMMNQIFILNIHRCFEKSHLPNRMFSIYSL